MALKKVSKLKDIAAAGAEAGTEAGVAGEPKVAKARAPGGRKSGRTWVIPRKRAEVIVQLAGNAGKDVLMALIERINKPDISVNNAMNIKYASSQVAKRPDAYTHCGTQQFDRLAYAIAHKESALTQEDLVELGLVPENEAGELMYDLVDASALQADEKSVTEQVAAEAAPAGETAPAE